jgi:hypothetical protein
MGLVKGPCGESDAGAAALGCPSTEARPLAVSYFGFMYQKIASATSATVMIHRTMSLLRFFSSAMKKSTPQVKFRFKCRFDFPGKPASGYGFAAAVAAPVRL